MKAGLTEREPEIIRWWRKNSVYRRLLGNRRNNQRFILHDGPPYANGNFHAGHALNKILKDIILKYKLLRGFYAPCIPGWDCHGLPIELAVQKKLSNKKDPRARDGIYIREKCREYAEDFIKIQAADQTRFGIFWDDEELLDDSGKPAANPVRDSNNYYYTMSPGYESAILRTFRDLFAAGLIYKGFRPVYWDIVTGTAHAEAEVEYENHTSPSVYVKFPVAGDTEEDPVFVAIWTTTPWTLPANLAVCFHPEFVYAIYSTSAGRLIIAEGLEEKFFQATGLVFSGKSVLTAEQIKSLKVRHPFLERDSLVVFGEHVTLDAGTGIVHTAPGHGQDDYQVGLRYDLKPYSPVDDWGRYTSDFPEMAGTKVWDANPLIIEKLKESGLLIRHEDYVHSYPHSWRSHAPLIVRSTPQWFMQIPPLRESAFAAIEQTGFTPDWGKTRFRAAVENRPDWCLSRQRHWGVPIPAFTCNSCGATHMTTETLDRVIALVQENGIEVWFNKDVSEITGGIKCSSCGSSDFRKETDILDVWFDSGVSWAAVCELNPELSSPADLYLEGSDQHRGWFQSSLWPSLALRQRAPYKSLLTHGYVLDEKGRAMSKSLGNGIEPNSDILPKYGADVLRLWVSSEDFRADSRIGFELLNQLSDSYRKIRNTLRYLLGNLRDGQELRELSDDNVIMPEDRWVLDRLARLVNQVSGHYDRYEFHAVYQKVLQFCTVTLSNEYFDIIRDRLYCHGNPDRPAPERYASERNSTLRTLDIILEALLVLLAPVLSFTTEEASRIRYGSDVSVFDRPWPDHTRWINDTVVSQFEPVWEMKSALSRELERLRKDGILGGNIEAEVTIPQNPTAFTLPELARFWVVSRVHTDPAVTEITARPAEGERCPRCWQYHELTESGLCHRCNDVAG